jgi:hypothetical protein
MSTGAKLDNQCRPSQAGGGQILDKAPTKQTLYQPPKFQGQSGQPNNQSTSRPKGST